MKSFSITVSDEELDDLRYRLDHTRYATAAPGEPWAAGVPPEYLRELVDYWRASYDWRAQEARLNSYPQFLADIEGTAVHFVHRPSTNPNAIPIILSHGWPYTFVEMLPLADELRDFHVVLPSLPGYGFSAVPATGDVTGPTIAETWHALMAELGYDRYLTYGEDIGAGASDWLAALHPESVRGIHAAHAGFPPRELRGQLSEVESDFFVWLADVWSGGDAYSEMQATRPDTLAATLSDSPAGLAAWIVEKFREWSDCHGDLESSFSKDQLLTTVMIYWISNSIATSFRPYYDDHRAAPLPPVTVPAGITVQQHENRYPRELADRTYSDVRFFHLLERGGHFTAAEAPDLVAADLRSFVATLPAE
ncbi:MAG TPA: epoxide hydrolase [Galbitalea sp.]